MILLVVLGILLGGFVFFVLNGIIIVEIVFSKIYDKRADGLIIIKYPSYKDFPNLNTQKISFYSGKNLLRGYIVKSKKISSFKSVVVLSHGIGSGHKYLLNLINFVCEQGYIVLAYDETACGISEGRKIYTMSQSINDLKNALIFKNNNEELRVYSTYLLGHSMGGFAVLNVLNFKDFKIEKCCSIAGFNNEESMALLLLKKVKFVYPLITLRNFFHVGKSAFLTSYKNLKKTTSEVLYIQGKLDSIVPPEIGGELYSKIKKENIHIKMIDDKYHAPHVLNEGQGNDVIGKCGLLGGVLTPYDITLDYKKMSEIDPDICKIITDFFNN